MPHLALPMLTSYLRSRDVRVVQRDLNLELFDEVLTRGYIERALARLRQDYGASIDERPPRRPLPERERIRWALTQGPQVADRIQKTTEIICSEVFWDGPTSLQAFLTVVQGLEIASLPFYPASLEFSSYVAHSSVDSGRNILQAVHDPQHNMFLDIFRRGIIADIEHEQPDLVGISIPTMEQMLAGMTLGYLIKESGLPCHVTIGGPHITMLREQLPKAPKLFNLFDSAILFEGEQPLLRLIEALDSDGDISKVPNLIYKEEGPRNRRRIRMTAVESQSDGSRANLRLPDFDGLPLDRYLTPELVLPLLTSRGCYHGKCAFCNVGYGESARFRQLRAEQVVDQMMALEDAYGAHHIFFADEAITPRNLREMSLLLEKRGTPVDWCGCVRFERTLSKDLLDTMARGGCVMLLLGLESASRPIIERIGKGIQIEQASRILRQSAEAGIWNHVFFFFGFPGETIDHAQETVDFVYEHKDAIHSASLDTFLLERYAPAHQFPETYGIKRVMQRPEKDLAIYFDYEVESGMSEKRADLAASRLIDVLPQKRLGHFYLNDAYRFLYASRLRDQGVPFPLWLVPEK